MAASSSGYQPVDESVLTNISVQFMEMVPLRRMRWQTHPISPDQLDMEVQKMVLKATVLHPICQEYPPSLSYRRAFLKKLLNMLEDYDVEICEEIYEVYTEILTEKEEEDDMLCYKTYTLGPGRCISLQESVNMISNGTTGLSTWQAAQHLAEWSLQTKHLLENKKILELGSGLGLTGIAVCSECSIKSYTFSDCHSQVLYLLSRNIEHNIKCLEQSSSSSVTSDMTSTWSESSNSGTKDTGETTTTDSHILQCIKRQLSLKADTLNSPEDDAGFSEICESPLSPADGEGEVFDDVLSKDFTESSFSQKHWQECGTRSLVQLKQDPRYRLAKLDWEEPDEEVFAKLLADTDVILAADVVYDRTIIPALIAVLKRFLSQPKSTGDKPCAYFASTIRNEDTRDQFLISMSTEGMLYEQMDSPTDILFHYDRSVPIEILKIVMTDSP